VFLIVYGICILLSLIGVVLGASNFAAGPVHYPRFVLVLWFLMNLALFVAIALHLAYYAIEIWNGDEGGIIALYVIFVLFPLIGGGIALLVNTHFGWFSASTLAALLICGVIDILMIRSGRGEG
jgi:hypothetical protein